MNFNINENMWYFLGNSKLYMEDILSSQYTICAGLTIQIMQGQDWTRVG